MILRTPATPIKQGITSRFNRTAEGYTITTLGGDGRPTTYRIAFTVGSRRIQQYVAQVNDRHVRVPLARAHTVAAWETWWRALDKRAFTHPGPAVPLTAAWAIDEARLQALLAQQDNSVVSIGE